jgi:hypothetical protein
VAERSNAAVSKTVTRHSAGREFESPPLRLASPAGGLRRPGATGLWSRLTPLAARSSTNPCVHTVLSGLAPPAAPRESEGRLVCFRTADSRRFLRLPLFVRTKPGQSLLRAVAGEQEVPGRGEHENGDDRSGQARVAESGRVHVQRPFRGMGGTSCSDHDAECHQIRRRDEQRADGESGPRLPGATLVEAPARDQQWKQGEDEAVEEPERHAHGHAAVYLAADQVRPPAWQKGRPEKGQHDRGDDHDEADEYALRPVWLIGGGSLRLSGHWFPPGLRTRQLASSRVVAHRKPVAETIPGDSLRRWRPSQQASQSAKGAKTRTDVKPPKVAARFTGGLSAV